MSNLFATSRFTDEEATVLYLETRTAIEIARFIRTNFPSNQKAAARRLRIGQGEVSSILSANLSRFSLEKLIKIARRAGLHLVLDMGASAMSTEVTAKATVVASVSKELPAGQYDYYIDMAELSPPIGATSTT